MIAGSAEAASRRSASRSSAASASRTSFRQGSGSAALGDRDEAHPRRLGSTGTVVRRLDPVVQGRRQLGGERVRGDPGRRRLRGPSCRGRCRPRGRPPRTSRLGPRPSHVARRSARGSPPGDRSGGGPARSRGPRPRPRRARGPGRRPTARTRERVASSPLAAGRAAPRPAARRPIGLDPGDEVADGRLAGLAPADRRLVEGAVRPPGRCRLAGVRCCWTQAQPPPPTAATIRTAAARATVSRARPWAATRASSAARSRSLHADQVRRRRRR